MEREGEKNRVEGRESPCGSNPLFSSAIKRKLARKEKRQDARAGYRADFSLEVNLRRGARSVFDSSRDSDFSYRELILLYH